IAAIIAGIGHWGAIQSASPSVAIEVSPVNIDDAEEIERSIAAFARSANGGLILTGSAFAILRRDLIIALAARHKLPAIYYDRYFIAAGGLISYGPDNVGLFRRAASYVDRILKGEEPRFSAKHSASPSPRRSQSSRSRRSSRSQPAHSRGPTVSGRRASVILPRRT